MHFIKQLVRCAAVSLAALSGPAHAASIGVRTEATWPLAGAGFEITIGSVDHYRDIRAALRRDWRHGWDRRWEHGWRGDGRPGRDHWDQDSAVVPLPGAAWMFGTAAAWLLGTARRRARAINL